MTKTVKNFRGGRYKKNGLVLGRKIMESLIWKRDDKGTKNKWRKKNGRNLIN